jgi:hypothetical protein
MRIIVSGALLENLMLGIKNFASDVEADIAYVDKESTPAIITIVGEQDSGLAELLGELSKLMRMFGVAK